MANGLAYSEHSLKTAFPLSLLGELLPLILRVAQWDLRVHPASLFSSGCEVNWISKGEAGKPIPQGARYLKKMQIRAQKHPTTPSMVSNSSSSCFSASLYTEITGTYYYTQLSYLQWILSYFFENQTRRVKQII